MIRYTTMDSPLGRLQLTSDDKGRLTSVYAPVQKGRTVEPDPSWIRDPDLLAGAVAQLDEYFARERKEFDLAVAPSGTDFRHRVWRALDDVPYGATVTYKELTQAAGLPPTSVRAVAGAVGANPLLILRPCHRVVGSDGSLTGFAAGLEAKQTLLGIEGR
ncbi:methylated-DNA--[protein]-cysteine S-methyltransferase [Streptacidiphilus neutrinimicus]|uniref:methylated-DNA--[protein]-cysteine S-methyltransferase n=1 Tax=Streptacidiphilus neutrinimicus TaxID=105420 RepID=UPI0005A7A8C9|nr:methylated-DNA--[protein]-cysteine S-methyltransferase [Streptacidiphilus neutrinimicus]